uniref:histidine kinase n=1 Tax=Solibacter usitatus (strain Ellin6076) TaxID=234267 RepID=Q01U27_SOLUE
MDLPSPGESSKWWRVSLRAKGVAVLAAPIAALFGALFSVYWVEADVRGADQDVARLYGIRGQLVELRGSLLDGQTKSAEAALDRIGAQTATDPVAAAALAEIRRAALAERGRVAMADLQARISLLDKYEEQRFDQARLQRDLARRRLFRTVILCGTLGPLAALFIHLVLAGRMVRRLQAVQENARRLAHGLPLETLPEGTDEIASLGSQLETAAFLLEGRERELRDSERRYRDLFDRAPIPYEEMDRNGALHRFNQAVCTLLKSTPEQMIGRLAWDFVAPDRQAEFRAAMKRRVLTGEESGPFECPYVLEDGTHLTVEIRENLIRNDRGEVTGIVRSLLDVTERNLAAVAARKVEQYALELRSKNEQLARALEGARAATVAKSRFLASVSHELRTPLNGIIGFSELLYDAKLGHLSGEQIEVMGDILTSARHLLQLINDILDLSKVEAGRMEFRPERSRLQPLVFEVRDVIRPLAERKNLVLATEVPEDLVAHLDPGRFRQVLYNYLSNAVKFTPAGGSVTVRIARERQLWFQLEVEDTGIGIAAEEIPRLFQEFSQLPNSRKADQGTGLGLALTRHIVEAQGGSVTVRSELGRGSVFSALLPLDSALRITSTQ